MESSSVSAARPEQLALTQKLRLAGEVAAVYARAYQAVGRDRDVRGALETLRAGDGATSRLPHVRGHADAARLGSVVSRVLRPIPRRSACLMRSLVLTALLARRGVQTKLVIGVHPGEDFGAHAWIEMDGRPLLPPGGSTFERLVEL